jgi:hypothetical protein
MISTSVNTAKPKQPIKAETLTSPRRSGPRRLGSRGSPSGLRTGESSAIGSPVVEPDPREGWAGCGQVPLPYCASPSPTEAWREAPCTTQATAVPLLVMKGSPVRVRASASCRNRQVPAQGTFLLPPRTTPADIGGRIWTQRRVHRGFRIRLLTAGDNPSRRSSGRSSRSWG